MADIHCLTILYAAIVQENRAFLLLVQAYRVLFFAIMLPGCQAFFVCKIRVVRVVSLTRTFRLVFFSFIAFSRQSKLRKSGGRWRVEFNPLPNLQAHIFGLTMYEVVRADGRGLLAVLVNKFYLTITTRKMSRDLFEPTRE